ncbi:MAG: BrnT family toxin [Treponema sp.]|nr:BrnT family toxin [Treponema sp.]
MRIVWDKNKGLTNARKHGISFDEAKTVFRDPCALLIADPDHSESEDRFVILGLSKAPRLLVVCHCYKENDDTIRIFSARKATRNEAEFYGGQ